MSRCTPGKQGKPLLQNLVSEELTPESPHTKVHVSYHNCYHCRRDPCSSIIHSYVL